MKQYLLYALLTLIFFNCKEEEHPHYDKIIRNGNIINGNNTSGYIGDVGINQDTIAFIGDLKDATADHEIDATGLTVAPGFINMLS